MEKKGSASFGEYLKTVRLEKGIRLSTISSQTRISRDTLEALEAEDHARLPADVFVKGFIRAYARVVGADGDVAVKGFVESRRTLVENNRLKSDENRPRMSSTARLLACLAVLLVIAIGGVLALRTSGPPETAETVVALPTETEKTAPALAEDKTKPSPATPAAPPAAPAAPAHGQPPPAPIQPAEAPTPAQGAGTGMQPSAAETAPPESTVPAKPQRIQIQVVEDTWLKVIVDSLSTNEYSLTPGDTLELEAAKGFNLLIGNATGIRLTFNDEPVPIPGKSGQVVTIQLP